jgi:hypothetical protein|nr:MAG TPA: hypothetical protein [Caudoviricetes sp.]
MKNKLTDLNDYLFEQIERINDDSLNEEELSKEIKKAEAIQGIAETIIKNGELQFKAAMKAADLGVINQQQMRFLLTGNSGGENGEKV